MDNFVCFLNILEFSVCWFFCLCICMIILIKYGFKLNLVKSLFLGFFLCFCEELLFFLLGECFDYIRFYYVKI